MPIVDVDSCARAGWSPIELTRAYLNGGATCLQLRAKSMSSGALLDLARAIVAVAHERQATVIVNDRADIARLAAAGGVHVGQDDLSPAAVRSIMGPDAVVGLSTHTAAQIEQAVGEPITYVAIGPVFGTASKVTGYDAIGLEAVGAAAAAARRMNVPLVAIGGITLERAGAVIEAGAACVAVISDLLISEDPERRTRDFLRTLGTLSSRA
jgi:thiamine-phosphate pyrophosphorylase